MVAAIHLARIFGPLLLIVGIWNLFYRHRVMQAAKGLKANSTVMYLHGILNLIVGLTIVTMFNHWVWDLTLLVTLFGWFLIVRGVFSLYWPEVITNLQLSTEGIITFWGIVWIVWGFFMTWLGYFCEMGRHTMMNR